MCITSHLSSTYSALLLLQGVKSTDLVQLRRYFLDGWNKFNRTGSNSSMVHEENITTSEKTITDELSSVETAGVPQGDALNPPNSIDVPQIVLSGSIGMSLVVILFVCFECCVARLRRRRRRAKHQAVSLLEDSDHGSRSDEDNLMEMVDPIHLSNQKGHPYATSAKKTKTEQGKTRAKVQDSRTARTTGEIQTMACNTVVL